jgi:hypothetical protein
MIPLSRKEITHKEKQSSQKGLFSEFVPLWGQISMEGEVPQPSL